MTIEWKTSDGLIAYPSAIYEMEQRIAAIRQNNASEIIWLLQHPPCYTAGTSARDIDLIDTHSFPVFQTGRGGQYTYHGPGQRIAYVMLDLQKRGINIRDYVCKLEKWIIATLEVFGICGQIRSGRIGVWVKHNDTESKIAAIGVRVSRGVAFHGVSINVSPDLTHFKGIIPCGISDFGVTSMRDLGVNAKLEDVDKVLQETFNEIFILQSPTCGIIGQ